MEDQQQQQKNRQWEKIKVFLRNSKSFHHRIIANYLRKRNWVVFYLKPKHRICNEGCCWLELYNAQQKEINDV